MPVTTYTIDYGIARRKTLSSSEAEEAARDGYRVTAVTTAE